MKLISTKQVLHKNTFNAGPQIVEIQTIDTGKNVVEVDIWAENGIVIRVGNIRVVSENKA